jgi:hypothetical protein
MTSCFRDNLQDLVQPVVPGDVFYRGSHKEEVPEAFDKELNEEHERPLSFSPVAQVLPKRDKQGCDICQHRRGPDFAIIFFRALENSFSIALKFRMLV